MSWVNAYKERLRAAGAMDVVRPIKIKTQKLSSNEFHAVDTHDPYDAERFTLLTTKTVHFQRHGQGYHNLFANVTRELLGTEIDSDDTNPSQNPFVRPELQDSPLTGLGRSEALSRRAFVNSHTAPQIVIVSPLHRAIQTALISFDRFHRSGVPFLAHEGCREQLGLFTCNKALPISQTKVDFPTIDFSLITHGEEDALWIPHAREEPLDESDRVYRFLTEFLMHRPEDEIAVVCHSAWLFSMCNTVMDCGGDESLESWFDTSELRSMKVSFYKESQHKL